MGLKVQHDIDGKVSAKRKWARVLIISGIIMSWIAFTISCFMSLYILIKEGTYQAIPTQLIYAQLGAGLGAIGFTIGERWNKNK